jgi:hypothetical protein
MPIGYDQGGGTGGYPGWTPDPEALADAWQRLKDLKDDIADKIEDAVEAVWGWVEKWRTVWQWVRRVVTEVFGVDWYRWQGGDCPVCMALNGMTWAEGEIPYGPPLHVNCDCSINYAYTELRTREVVEWSYEPFQEQFFAWEQTGWS